MGIGISRKATIRRIGSDTRLVERKAVRDISKLIKKLRSKVSVATPLFDTEKTVKDLQELLVDVAVFSHLLGMKRSARLRPKAKSLSLNLLTQSIKGLEKQLGITALQLEPEYITNVLKTVRALTEPVEKELRSVLVTSQREGLHVSETIKDMQSRFDRLNVSANAETLVRTQTQLAYSAGRWQADQDPDIQEILWGYEYVAITDDRVRPEHEAFDGTILPKDDPFWKTAWPPNGWNCRCSVIPLYEEEAKQSPTKLSDGSAAIPDKGFVGNVGLGQGRKDIAP